MLVLTKCLTMLYLSLLVLVVTAEVFLDRRIKTEKETTNTAVSLFTMWSSLAYMIYTISITIAI
jgi:hypothetical protein